MLRRSNSMLAGKPLGMILTTEVAGLAASVLGVLGLILRKARCFIRRVGNSWDGGSGFCDVPLLKSNGNGKCVCPTPPVNRELATPKKLREYLSMASQFVGLARGVVKTAQVISPYLRTGLALAAAV